MIAESDHCFIKMGMTHSPPMLPPAAQSYSSNHAAFLSDWCPQYQEMSLLGVDPVPAGFSVTDGWTASVTPTPAPGPNPGPNPNPNPNGGGGGRGL